MNFISRAFARRLVAVVTVVVGCVTLPVAAVAAPPTSGLGGSATPSFPGTVTVGQTAIPASITFSNQNTGIYATETNTVCNALDAAPCPAATKGITITPSCAALGDFSVCDTPDLGILKISATGIGEAGSSCATTPFDITPIAGSTTGQLRVAPHGGGNVTLPGFASYCTVDFTFDVLKVPAIDQDPHTDGVQTVQITDNTQWFSSITTSNRGTTNGMTVLKATPAIVTTASESVGIGGQISDHAVLSGRAFPTTANEPVTFTAYGVGDENCTGPAVFTSTVAVNDADGTATSAPFTPTKAGTYRWIASYAGDGNNNAVTAPCNATGESVVVTGATPVIATAASGNVPLGLQISDAATVSGRVNPVAGSTVTFSLFGPNDATCSTTAVFTSTVALNADGTATSAPYTPTAPGTYRWIASYSGDVNNVSVAAPCNGTNENVNVGFIVSPTLATAVSGSATVGGQIADQATLTGLVNPVAGATVTFNLYGPDDTNCARAAIYTSTVSVNGAGSATSGSYTTDAIGVYRWIATYSGDANNNPVAGACGESTETITVKQAAPTISSVASGNVAPGGGLSDQVLVLGRASPVAGGTVVFQLFGPDDATCAKASVFTTTVAINPDGTATSGAFTASVVGVYRWIATYTGDANNLPVAAPCNAANESASVLGPDLLQSLPVTT